MIWLEVIQCTFEALICVLPGHIISMSSAGPSTISGGRVQVEVLEVTS